MPKRLNVALLSTDEDLGLKVLACLGEMDATVHMLGKPRPTYVNASRWCDTYVRTEVPRTPDGRPAFYQRLKDYAADHAIDVFVPSDEVAADLLASGRDAMPGIKSYSAIDMDRYVALHDKAKFAQFLTENDIPTPRSSLIAKLCDLDEERLAPIGFPAIVKPLAMYGGAGVEKVETFEALRAHVLGDGPDNELPLLLQEFVPGVDLDVSVLAIEGEVVAWTAQRWIGPNTLEFIENEEMLGIARKIARQSALHGVAHFDMRRDTRDSQITVIECNPRFWWTLPASAWRGVNFVEIGIDWALDGTLPTALPYRTGHHYFLEAVTEWSFWRPSTMKHLTRRNVRAMLRELSDPMPYLVSLFAEWRESVARRFRWLFGRRRDTR